MSKRREKWVEFSHLFAKNIRNFFKSRGDRQMTEIFVSGTEVFSDAKTTETPYEWRRVDMYVPTWVSTVYKLNVGPNGDCEGEVKKRVQAGWNGWRRISDVEV